MRRLLAGLLPLILLALVLGAEPVQAAQTATVSFVDGRTSADFPAALTFEVTAVSGGAAIETAQLVFYPRTAFSLPTFTRVPLPITPGERVDLAYRWATGGGTIVPGAAFFYYWEVTDAAGRVTRSETQLVRYEDTRFAWQVRENEAIAVWWHDRPARFGDDVFAIAAAAVKRQRALFGVDLAFQIRILIYNDFDEFAEWHSFVSEFVGGQAFPDQGVTAQIVSGFGSQQAWLNSVVPHEISHLYFAQAATNASAPTPVWLDEGVASYNEFGDPAFALRTARTAAERGELLILSTLSQGFGSFDEARARLAYDVSLSAVVYLVETYGEAGLARLLAAYKAGRPTDEAFQSALGISLGAFERDWAAWLGAAEGTYVTPTPWPLPTFRPSPTARVVAVVTASVGPATAEPAPAAPTSAATAIVRAATATEPAAVAIAPLATAPPTQSPSRAARGTGAVWGGLAVLALLAVGGGLWLRRRAG